VFTSIEWSARTQGVGKLYGLQAYMRRQPGGGWPEKVDRVVAAYAKSKVGYVHIVDDSAESYADLLAECLRAGLYPSITWGGDVSHYRGQRIDHMVSLVSLTDSEVGILDNNFPSEILYVDRPTALRRMAMGTTTDSYFWSVVVFDGGALPSYSAASVVPSEEGVAGDPIFGVDPQRVIESVKRRRGLIGDVSQLLSVLSERRGKVLVIAFGSADVSLPPSESRVYVWSRSNDDWLRAKLGADPNTVVAVQGGKLYRAPSLAQLLGLLFPPEPRPVSPVVQLWFVIIALSIVCVTLFVMWLRSLK